MKINNENKIPEKNFSINLKTLETWEQFSEVKYYCGYGYYSKEIKK